MTTLNQLVSQMQILMESNNDLQRQLKTALTKIDTLEKKVKLHNIEDTRSKNESPKFYRNKGCGEYKEFKNSHVLGISDKIFVMLKTIVMWKSHDDGCTQITQIAYGNNMYMRKGSPFDNTWSRWVKLNNEDITFDNKVDCKYSCIYPLLKIMFLHNAEHKNYSQFKCHYINNMIKDEYTHDIIYNFLHTILYVIEYMDDFTDYLCDDFIEKKPNSNISCKRKRRAKKSIPLNTVIEYDISNLPNIVNHLYKQFQPYKSNDTLFKSSEYIINIWTSLFENETIKRYLADPNRDNNYNIDDIILLLKPIVDTYKEINNVLDNAPHGKKWGYNMIIHKFIADNYPDTLYF
jgi:hypothetical protein